MAVAVAYVALFVIITSLPLVFAHSALHGFSLLQASLAVFCGINTLVSIWEIGLFINLKTIKAEYEAFRKELKGREFPEPMFMFAEVPFKDAITLKFWTLVWSTYALMDPSYQDEKSFGFWVDVGNGFTTIIPTILFALCMTWPLLPARVLGVVCMIKFYQEMYGTIIYFSTFVFNQRYKGKSLLNIITIVILSNMVWIVFPLIGIYACWNMIDTNSYALFQ